MSTPTVSGNVVYVHDSQNLYAFDAAGNIVATGQPPAWQVWTFGKPADVCAHAPAQAVQALGKRLGC